MKHNFDLKNIRLVLLDVDGVLTDGRIGLLPTGEEIKFFSIYDGLAIKLLQRAGVMVGFLSGRKSQSVEIRAEELGISIVVQGSKDKVRDFKKILADEGLKSSEVVYIGDDLPDVALLKSVGFSAAPSNAVESVKTCVDYVTRAKGGYGVVREVVDVFFSEIY